MQGLPARYGAFEQTVENLVSYAEKKGIDCHFFVGCSQELIKYDYQRSKVSRIFSKRSSGIGVIRYGLISFLKMYYRGVRDFFVFGYALSPFFFLFKILGCKIICNVDGIEWRRAKWGKIAKAYFKFCEYMAAKSDAKLIFDAIGIERYFNINHNRKGILAFYGSEYLNLSQIITPASDYFVVVMRLEPENHIKEIVQGFLLCPFNKKLIIVGPSTKFFKNEVLPLIIETDRINWIGPIYDRKKLFEIRVNAKAYIHGHSVGGTNPTLVEACHIGRPIIAFNSIFNREILNKNALFFTDAKSLANCLTEELIPPPKLDSRYTWEYVCEKYFAALN